MFHLPVNLLLAMNKARNTLSSGYRSQSTGSIGVITTNSCVIQILTTVVNFSKVGASAMQQATLAVHDMPTHVFLDNGKNYLRNVMHPACGCAIYRYGVPACHVGDG
jgi:hypothetical protein